MPYLVDPLTISPRAPIPRSMRRGNSAPASPADIAVSQQQQQQQQALVTTTNMPKHRLPRLLRSLSQSILNKTAWGRRLAGRQPKQLMAGEGRGSSGSDASLGTSGEVRDKEHDGSPNYRFLTSHLDLDKLAAMPITDTNALSLMRDIELLMADERLMVADALLTKLQDYATTTESHAARRVREGLATPRMAKKMTKLRNRVEICHQAFRDLDSNENWTFAQTVWGVTTHYRLDESDRSLTVRLQGELSGCSVFDQLAILREADMYHHWGPFINKSGIVKEVGKMEMVIWFNIYVPLIASRDAVVHVFACDYTEKGILLVCGGSLDNDIPEDDVKVPPVAAGWGNDRMNIKDFRVQIRIKSPTTCEVHIIANIQPKVPLPQSVINFATKKCAGVLLHYLQLAALKIPKDPVSNLHACRMRASRFYSDYFIPRVVSFCTSEGWVLGSVPAFEVAEDCAATRKWKAVQSGDTHVATTTKPTLSASGVHAGDSTSRERATGAAQHGNSNNIHSPAVSADHQPASTPHTDARAHAPPPAWHLRAFLRYWGPILGIMGLWYSTGLPHKFHIAIQLVCTMLLRVLASSIAGRGVAHTCVLSVLCTLAVIVCVLLEAYTPEHIYTPQEVIGFAVVTKEVCVDLCVRVCQCMVWWDVCVGPFVVWALSYAMSHEIRERLWPHHAHRHRHRHHRHRHRNGHHKKKSSSTISLGSMNEGLVANGEHEHAHADTHIDDSQEYTDADAAHGHNGSPRLHPHISDGLSYLVDHTAV